MRLLKKEFHVPTRPEPIRSIEWVIAILTCVGGFYIFTPLYTASQLANGPSTLAQALSHPLMIMFFGAVLLVGAILVMVGLITKLPQLRSIGWFSIIMARSFQILTTWLTAGLFPISWIYPLTIVGVIVILWALARIEVHNASS